MDDLKKREEKRKRDKTMIVDVETNIVRDLQDHSVILHQVNCAGAYQPGVASQLSKSFTGWFQDYHSYCKWFADGHTDEIMGTFHRYPIKGQNVIICSAFCQEGSGKDFIETDLDAWDEVLKKVYNQTKYVNKKNPNSKWTIHIPENIGTTKRDDSNEDLMQMFQEYFGESEDVDLYIHHRVN